MNSLKLVKSVRSGNIQCLLNSSRGGLRCFSCSTTHYDNFKCKLLVVGGGAGGCSVAAKASSAMGANKVIILEPADNHYYQPMFTLVGGGMKKLEDTSRPMKDVLPIMSEWIKDKAVKFDPKVNQVTTAKGDTIEYEYLLMATGLQLNYDQIPGLEKALAVPGGPVCSIYSAKYANRTYEALQNFKSGNAIFTFPNSPVKCPGAPQKIFYIAEQYLKKNSKRKNANIMYNTALPVIFGVKHYADALWKIVEKRGLKVNLRTNLVEVLPNGRQAVFENLDKPGEKTTVDFELLHVVPPMSTSNELKACSDLVNEAGFVEVNKDTMQHVRFPNVFAIGDCASSPNSKTAAAVAAQCQVVYKNLMSVMSGHKPTRVYDGYASCPIVTGYSKCILAEFDYNLQPLETFPFAQNKERWSMFFMKKDLMPALYWHLCLNGLWNGPGFMRNFFAMFRKW